MLWTATPGAILPSQSISAPPAGGQRREFSSSSHCPHATEQFGQCGFCDPPLETQPSLGASGLWNSLPPDLEAATCLDGFNRK